MRNRTRRDRIVYEADDNCLGRKVAIKVLHAGTESAERMRRFAEEARDERRTDS